MKIKDPYLYSLQDGICSTTVELHFFDKPSHVTQTELIHRSSEQCQPGSTERVGPPEYESWFQILAPPLVSRDSGPATQSPPGSGDSLLKRAWRSVPLWDREGMKGDDMSNTSMGPGTKEEAKNSYLALNDQMDRAGYTKSFTRTHSGISTLRRSVKGWLWSNLSSPPPSALHPNTLLS